MTVSRILITRPEPAASAWQAQLAECGWAADIVSCMVIDPLREPAAEQAIKNHILAFDEYHKVIFVSRNAVAHALHWLDQYWPQLPVGIEYFAIGESTAEALREADIVPSALGGAESPMNSETLLTSSSLQNVADERILICKGEGGRDLLAQTLSARGAQVNQCALYRRVIPSQALEQLRWWLLNWPAGVSCDAVITAHSGESLQNLVTLARSAGGLATLLTAPVVVPGQRVAALARELGFERVSTALNAGDRAMQKALEPLLGSTNLNQ
ncbi:uroporphyrinogen-III synthase [Gilvimarinus agarilyticus]|uniref:uroporphyrinogen-III synthase n=1 Tax=Gilvimarinus sp. 2_MG-2023 TaxID=3062666 RepID=UPI001C08DEC3|nr:uroporphyrinogen-III synthase [Gilvimarinus sp. 2_MG-2023]MBU2884602.1 uroporphyrinogen-III synthase [Gilvimarinus agarilyticus]MDO6569711.1 uroporphyrinogen-III synthase [Gilvimarinus sp. 2_MG-2023]